MAGSEKDIASRFKRSQDHHEAYLSLIKWELEDELAITEQFANIYTFESPGGWNILGNTPLEVFDSSKEDKPNLINPGDTVIFKEITLDQYKNFNEQ